MTVQCEFFFAAFKQRDAEAVMDALDGIAIIHSMAGELSRVATTLEECGGLHRIELLQHHSHEVVRSKTVQILELLSPDDVQNEQNKYEKNGCKQYMYEENRYKQTCSRRTSIRREGG